MHVRMAYTEYATLTATHRLHVSNPGLHIVTIIKIVHAVEMQVVPGLGLPVEDARQACRQWFFFSRNICELTLKIIYFDYLKKSLLDQSIKKYFI